MLLVMQIAIRCSCGDHMMHWCICVPLDILVITHDVMWSEQACAEGIITTSHVWHHTHMLKQSQDWTDFLCNNHAC